MDKRSRRVISLYRRLIDITFVIDAWRLRVNVVSDNSLRRLYIKMVASFVRRQNKIQAAFNVAVARLDDKERSELSSVLEDFIEVAKMNSLPFSSTKEHIACLRWVVHALHNMRAY